MKRRVTILILIPLLAIALSIIPLWEPASALATAQGPASHLLGIKPGGGPLPAVGAATTSNMIYRGGPIMPATANVYAIFWEPSGSFVSPTYNSLILRYFSDVGSSGLYHNNTQYHDIRGNIPSSSALAASWVDTARYPSRRLSDRQIQIEVLHAISVNHWSASLSNVFFVFTAKGELVCAGTQCSFSSFCAYHSVFSGRIYATIPYAGTNLAACGVPLSPNQDPDADSAINVTSHEQMEAATDPLLNAWSDRSGGEIGDKCAWNFGGISVFNGHPYLVQKEWDNVITGCTLVGP